MSSSCQNIQNRSRNARDGELSSSDCDLPCLLRNVLTSLLDLSTSLGELDEDNVAERLLGVVSDADGADVGGVVKRDPLVLLGESLLNAADSDGRSEASSQDRSGEGLGCRTDSRPAEKLDGGADSSEHVVQ